MEYLLVRFPEKRRVIIDDIDTGQHAGEVIEVVNGLKDFSINDRRYFWAKNQAEYQNNKADHPYLHLMDAGLSDNLGLRYIIDEYVRTSGLLFQRKGTIQHLVIIVVNAKTQPQESIDRQEKSPGLMDVAYKTATVSMDNYSFETVQAAKEMKNSNWYRQVGKRAENLCEMMGS
ncbi:MAG: hypothetical protein LWX55_04090 [Deltaproteobacteria bacterium]|nr:hypothetical protein [Deltaproteobacteria bacterium]